MKHLIASLLLGLLPLAVPAQENIKPLVKTQWGQGAPFNLLCPVKTDSTTLKKVHAKAGCVAVAVAQVVRNREYPSVSPDGKTPYEWQKMFNIYYQGIEKESLVAVAKLISDCGVQSRAQYGPDASGAYTKTAVDNMKRLMRFSKYMMPLRRDEYAGEEGLKRWKDIIYGELAAGRPVIFSGTQKQKNGKRDRSHAFIVDGYKNGKFHVNFGWDGLEDGYYDIEDLNGYSERQVAVVNIADSTYIPETRQVKLSAAGTLKDHFAPEDLKQVYSLKITGKMNADDYAFLRSLSTYSTKTGKGGVLAAIDLSDLETTELPDTAFKNCNKLVYVKLPRGIKTIPAATFYNCHLLNFADIPEGTETIGKGAFAGCRSLIKADLPESVTTIGRKAYRYCSSLIAVNLPRNIAFVGDEAFSDCEQLRWINLPEKAQTGKGLTLRSKDFKELTRY
ncbi:hypothetical protein C7120_00195 [Prevotella sp. oral taxon 376]|uniref:C10 family peptidase n=1 Tax=Prevotella sp. oral taxon 376 TaxID=712466 RepID=UPI000D1DA10A|nr:C10 family peptidase [Prevotella sp. oral taxon 376]PTL33094.1 hypothetical protein C7120_00195 [Prevotella sp. oral taxon 376]